nr:DUF6503 family protein [Allomuricauda sp.]
MRTIVTILGVLLISSTGMAQSITPKDVLEKSIAFHDPNNNWGKFQGSFKVVMETPNSSNRSSVIHLDIPKQQFVLEVEKDGAKYAYSFDKKECTITLNNSNDISGEDRKKYRLTCERGQKMRDYYTYLYGLPMKIKDPGAHLGEQVERKTFKGKEYLVLKVTYDENVGRDVWYFYFDPSTYAMEVYQFYHDVTKGDGEYITLQGLEEINGIKMPKTRAWYYNKNNKYLGTDILEAQD